MFPGPWYMHAFEGFVIDLQTPLPKKTTHVPTACLRTDCGKILEGKPEEGNLGKESQHVLRNNSHVANGVQSSWEILHVALLSKVPVVWLCVHSFQGRLLHLPLSSWRMCKFKNMSEAGWQIRTNGGFCYYSEFLTFGFKIASLSVKHRCTGNQSLYNVQ